MVASDALAELDDHLAVLVAGVDELWSLKLLVEFLRVFSSDMDLELACDGLGLSIGGWKVPVTNVGKSRLRSDRSDRNGQNEQKSSC